MLPPFLIAQRDLGPTEYTIGGVLIFVLGLLSKRVLAWGYQLDEKDREIERLRAQVAALQAKNDEYLAMVLQTGRVAVEALPKIQRSLAEGSS